MLKNKDHAQLSELATPAGTLDRRVAIHSWFVPGIIRLENENLRWNYLPESLKSGRQLHPSQGMLEGFLELAQAPDRNIARYAKHWGVLGICEHRLPSSHSPDMLELRKFGCRPLGWEDGECWEPLDTWRHFVTQAFSLLKIANRVHQGKTADPSDWARVYARSRSGVPTVLKAPSPEMDKHLLVMCLNEWLTLGNVSLRIDWSSEDRPTVKFNTHGLFGALAVQLVLSAAQVDGWAICTHCRSEYMPPKRQPKTGQRNFCPSCRSANIPRKYAMRAFASRKRMSTGKPRLRR